MCSTCDCNKDPIKSETDESFSAKCRRCGAKPFIILDKIHIDCRECFLESCNRKIRSTIGKSRLIKNNDPILITHSGGASSTALLSLIKSSIDYDQRRQQKFRPSILHVDTRSALDMDFDQCREERLLLLSKLLEQTQTMYPDWPLYWTTLEMFLAPSNVLESIYARFEQCMLTDPKYDLLLNNSKLYEKFHDVQKKNQDLTDRQNYIQSSISGLIDKIANDLNSVTNNPCDQFKFVLKASSATQLANNLLVNVILGEGSTIASTVSICDQRPLVPILRPMREFSKKEIAFYLRAKCLEFTAPPNAATLADRKASIQKVTESFLSKLYVDYPSTYSTLLRTGNKMQD